jgi:hypothetical protein
MEANTSCLGAGIGSHGRGGCMGLMVQIMFRLEFGFVLIRARAAVSRSGWCFRLQFGFPAVRLFVADPPDLRESARRNRFLNLFLSSSRPVPIFLIIVSRLKTCRISQIVGFFLILLRPENSFRRSEQLTSGRALPTFLKVDDERESRGQDKADEQKDRIRTTVPPVAVGIMIQQQNVMNPEARPCRRPGY